MTIGYLKGAKRTGEDDHTAHHNALTDAANALLNTNGSLVAPAAGLVFPTADPHVAWAWRDSAGTLTKSAG